MWISGKEIKLIINQSTYRPIVDKKIMRNNMGGFALRLSTPPYIYISRQKQMRKIQLDEIFVNLSLIKSASELRDRCTPYLLLLSLAVLGCPSLGGTVHP